MGIDDEISRFSYRDQTFRVLRLVVSSLVMLISVQVLFGQKNIDSLVKVSLNVKLDEQKRMAALEALSEHYRRIQPDSSLYYADHHLQLALDSENELEESDALNQRGMVFLSRKELTLALSAFEKSLKLRRKYSDTVRMAGSMVNIGNAYYYKRNMSEAMQYFQEGYKLAEAGNNSSFMLNALNNIGGVYYAYAQYDSAIEAFDKVILLREATNDRKGLASALINTGALYNALGDREKALSYFYRGLDVCEETQNLEFKVRAIINIGRALISQGKYNDAISYYNQALEIDQTRLSDPEIICQIYSQLSSLYSKILE